MLTINLALDIDWVHVLDMNYVADGRKLKFTKVDLDGNRYAGCSRVPTGKSETQIQDCELYRLFQSKANSISHGKNYMWFLCQHVSLTKCQSMHL